MAFSEISGTVLPNTVWNTANSSNGDAATPQPCAKASDCPDGAYCADPTPAACAADAHGRIVYFIFDGNPVGDNADLSQELFAWRNKGNGGQLLQLTKQTAYCDTDPSRACTAQRDCVTPKTPGATCVKPQMTDLQVGPNGRTVMIRTTGDLGSNTDHSEALYLITVGGKKMSTALLAGGGNPKACTAETEHPYSACTTDADCGATCGDGRRQGTEQCESAADCGTGAVCDGCTCRPVSCGDGFVDPSEACEPSTGCNGTCSPDCKTCTPAS